MVIHGTIIGVTTAPMLVPELNRPGRQRALLHRKPLRHDFDRRRKVAGLAEAEREPRRMKPATDGAIGQAEERQQRGRGRPNNGASACAMAARLQTMTADRKAGLRAEAIDDAGRPTASRSHRPAGS